jgi:hypothetical protein
MVGVSIDNSRWSREEGEGLKLSPDAGHSGEWKKERAAKEKGKHWVFIVQEK